MMVPSTRRSATRTTVLFIGSLAFGLVAAELVVRAAIPVRNVGPTFSEYDPLYGKRLKKDFRCTRTSAEFTMNFSTNSLGFRGPEPNRFPSAGILFLGDSFTSGYGVSDGEEFPDLIRRMLESRRIDVPVVNAGLGNTGDGYWLRFLERDIAQFAPRALVLGFCRNDFTDNVVEGFYSLGPDGTLLSNDGPPRHGLARRLQEGVEAIPGLAYSHLISLARQAFSESGSGPALEDTSADLLTWTILEAVFSECNRLNLPTEVVTIGLDGSRLDKMRTLAAHHGFPVLAIPTKSERPDLYFQIDDHWNAAGHAYTAEALLPGILHTLGYAQ